MKKIVLSLMLLTLSLFAELTNQDISQKLIASKIPIVDIRTPGEWRDEGILPTAIPIMFFDETGNYDVNAFLKELNEKVDTKKQFAIICRTGSRTSMLAPWHSQELKYNVINLTGGMDYATRGLHIQTVRYMK